MSKFDLMWLFRLLVSGSHAFLGLPSFDRF